MIPFKNYSILRNPPWLALLALPFSAASFAADSTWSIAPYVGVSVLSGTDGAAENVDNQSGSAAVDVDNGFVAGLAIDYQWAPRWSAQLAWEYRSNDSTLNIDNSSNFPGGNYASNTLFVSARYSLLSRNNWQLYTGAGISWMQEVDIDLERDGEEQSYSGRGDVGFQLLVGADYRWHENWAWTSELRFARTSDIDLKGEAGAEGEINNLDYGATTLQTGLRYSF